MATVNFSVPEEIKEAFNRTFAKNNKSAIIAELMMQAVENEKRRKKRSRAVETILKLRAISPAITEQEFRAAREQGRK
ncbi:MAG: hypothetical protein ACR2FI_10575 [Burkholderiales bacterium]|nr:hypothetical protein [Burkholderiales bacterium]MDQ3195060.1 hypothetical protein [Pseudomonadota bacterium]